VLVLVLIIVAVLIIAIVLTALSGRYRRFDAVVQPEDSVVPLSSHRNRMEMIPKSEQVTDSDLTKANAYDEPDDLLDPRNPRHAQWLKEQQLKPSGDSTPSDETS
jgi:hypothetical protein